MRLEGIDLLRGIAVIAVIIYHFFSIFGLYSSPIFPYIHSFGLFGVSLFFIISGYLIYRSIDYAISSKGIWKGLKHYTLHRVFRIVPAYYFNFSIVLILATFIINSQYLYSNGFFRQIISHLTFLSFFVYKDTGFGINGVYWSLSIEMLWYIIAPIFFIYIKKDRYLVILFILSFFYLLGLDLALYDSFLNLDKNASNYKVLQFFWSFQLPGQLIYFIGGIFIYKHMQNHLTIIGLIKYPLVIFIFSFFVYIESHYNLHTNFLLNNFLILLTVATLFILLYKDKPRFMGGIEWIGKISYSLYLWHMPILFVMHKSNILEHRSVFETTLYFLVLLFSISSMSYYFIEEGGFNLRRKLEETKKRVSHAK